MQQHILASTFGNITLENRANVNEVSSIFWLFGDDSAAVSKGAGAKLPGVSVWPKLLSQLIWFGPSTNQLAGIELLAPSSAEAPESTQHEPPSSYRIL